MAPKLVWVNGKNAHASGSIGEPMIKRVRLTNGKSKYGSLKADGVSSHKS